ncbi:hypothetical protein GE09DRAFT_1169617 [Coniochaeta sp. 2T2.1]|nr:hypothetical protein GE09DRAFT_1169617 [Coniochaeta sp. 2T2.1]
MNSDEKRLLRHLEDNFNNPTIYTYIHNFYSSHRLADRVLSPGFLISLALVVAVLYHHLSSDSPSATLEALPDLLWDVIVRATPARLLYAFDSWLNPPLFPLPMLQTQTRSTSHAAKSEVLRRVLGMDKAGGIMATVSQAGRRSLSGFSGGSPLAMFKGDPEQPAGLGNVSNSCYQNSVLQGLASLKPLRTYLASVDTQAVTEKKAGTVDTLRQLVADLNNPTNNGKTLWTPSILKSMSTWQQQDAQEYFSKLLDEIDREMARLYTPPKPPGYESDALSSSSVSSSSGKDDTVASQHSDDSGYQSMLSHHPKSTSDSLFLRNPLEGLQAQRVACTACGHSDGLSMIPFNCLTLNLGVDGNEHNLYERLDSYTKVEPIPGVECGKCTLLKYQSLITKLIASSGKSEADWPEPYSRLAAINAALEEDDFDDATIVKKCKIRPEHKVASTKTKQAVIARPPQSLVIHMNRSVFDERTGRMWKNMAAVRFPSLLDLGPWCLGSARTPEGKEDEQWILRPEESMVAGSESDGGSKISGPIFELRAVVTHYGRHENGHYVAYRRHAKQPLQEEKPAKLAGEKQPVEEVDGVAGFEGIDDEKKQGQEGKEIREEEEEEESHWWRLSDQNVEKVDEEQVLAQGNVFMLFYDCVDPNSTLVGEERFEDSGGGDDPNKDPRKDSTKDPGEAEAEESEDSFSDSEDEAPEPKKPQPVEEGQRHGPLTRAEMIARAKTLFAQTAERAAGVPLPDEDEDL